MDLMIKVLVAIILGGAITWIALTTMPKEDDCTQDLVARYTIVIISHQECVALGAQCVITPRDIEKVRSNQKQLQECIMGFVKKAADESVPK